MNPIALTLTAVAAWLVGAFFAWSFVHGAQILRRQEAAGTDTAVQVEAAADGLPAHAPFIVSEPARISEAA